MPTSAQEVSPTLVDSLPRCRLRQRDARRLWCDTDLEWPSDLPETIGPAVTGKGQPF